MLFLAEPSNAYKQSFFEGVREFQAETLFLLKRYT